MNTTHIALTTATATLLVILTALTLAPPDQEPQRDASTPSPPISDHDPNPDETESSFATNPSEARIRPGAATAGCTLGPILTNHTGHHTLLWNHTYCNTTNTDTETGPDTVPLPGPWTGNVTARTHLFGDPILLVRIPDQAHHDTHPSTYTTPGPSNLADPTNVTRGTPAHTHANGTTTNPDPATRDRHGIVTGRTPDPAYTVRFPEPTHLGDIGAPVHTPDGDLLGIVNPSVAVLAYRLPPPGTTAPGTTACAACAHVVPLDPILQNHNLTLATP